ncbi:hypothetical protein [Chitinophaga silvisoli]|uniref:TerB family tellurite resistance protein n=1 Tax=Chitinophaga silvisoli TaxID=2291814 RepID=A0A3E1P2L8_9BACT|nr:hypothetical protein [Chitinophaga silvisoli]RFM34429.1 hypothetical protein DXN04_14200 [Chitinophaga silvisoli]
MKTVILLLYFLILAPFAHSQTWDEWFNQKKTQKKYLLAQIAAFHTYGEYLKKGYDIAKGGLNAIHDIENGEFGLHRDYFNSLKQVSPAVRQNASLIEAANNIDFAIKLCTEAKQRMKGNDRFLPAQREFYIRCLDTLLGQIAVTLDDLMAVTTNGRFQMTDDERIERINKVLKANRAQAADAGRYYQLVISIDKSIEKQLSEDNALQVLLDVKM